MKEKAAGLLKLTRPINSAIVGLAVIVGAFIASATPDNLKLLLGFLTGFLLTAASMTINDFLDKGIDAINEPRRPIPSGAISSPTALAYSIVLTLLGLTSAFLIGLVNFLVALLLFAMAVAYNKKRKELSFLGNVMVGISVSASFVYGGLVVDKMPLLLVLFSLIALFVVTGREVTKGIADIEGDRSKGVKTLAVLKGENFAVATSTLLYLSSIGLTSIPILMNEVNLALYLPPILVTDCGLLYSFYPLLKRITKEKAKKAKREILIWMMVGLLAFLLGGIRSA